MRRESSILEANYRPVARLPASASMPQRAMCITQSKGSRARIAAHWPGNSIGFWIYQRAGPSVNIANGTEGIMLRFINVPLASFAAAIAVAHAASPSIKDLDRLIGTWQYDDRSLPALGFDYRETGVRTCDYALNGAYIRCVSIGNSNGKPRTYEFNFNYNAIDERLEMVAMFSDYGPKQTYALSLSDHGSRIDLVRQRTQRRGQGHADQIWATIVFEGNGKMVWTTRRNRSTQPPDAWPAITIDNAQRIPRK